MLSFSKGSALYDRSLASLEGQEAEIASWHPMLSEKELPGEALGNLLYYVHCCDALLWALLEMLEGTTPAPPLTSLAAYASAGYGVPAVPGISGTGRDLVDAMRTWLRDTDARALPKDPLQELYCDLLPGSLRRQLGEFPTPPALAAELVREAARELSPAPKVIVDPSCGTGVFLATAMEYFPEATVVGCDVNPIALLASYATYVLTCVRLGRRPPRGHSPIFMADVLTDSPARLAEALAQAVGAPDECQGADLVVGNPPWINRTALSPAYRQRVDREFLHYGLLPGGKRVGSVKADVASLFASRTADLLVRGGGMAALLLPQSLFKSEAAARFRLLQLPCGTRLRPVVLHDLHALQLFEGATNRTAFCLLRKGEPPVYPVRNITWKREQGHLRTGVGAVAPIDGTPGGPWATVGRNGPTLRQGTHTLRLGVNTGGGTGVLWVDILSANLAGQVLIRNRGDAGRIKMPQLPPVLVERDYLFPLVRARNISPWKISYQHYILMAHTRDSGIEPVAEADLTAECPLTRAYLEKARPALEARRAVRFRWGGTLKQGWYRLFEVGTYTFKPVKVMIKAQVATTLVAAVAEPVDDPYLGNTIVIPDQTVSFIGCRSREEAYFYCGLLNSAPLRAMYQSLGYKHMTKRVFQSLPLPLYNPADPLHTALAAAAVRRAEAGAGLEAEGDRAVDSAAEAVIWK
ncbi:MAG TPA: hypothetical protein VD902_18405 [Symbiobacteriaceae bacterium]|nr:hypothetical protein [Symbiobacteriaceae bacterium]